MHGSCSFLRQDPGIIMIDEIRDTETAHVAVQAAITGHLVLSTLHTSTPPGPLYISYNYGHSSLPYSSDRWPGS